MIYFSAHSSLQPHNVYKFKTQAIFTLFPVPFLPLSLCEGIKTIIVLYFNKFSFVIFHPEQKLTVTLHTIQSRKNIYLHRNNIEKEHANFIETIKHNKTNKKRETKTIIVEKRFIIKFKQMYTPHTNYRQVQNELWKKNGENERQKNATLFRKAHKILN